MRIIRVTGKGQIKVKPDMTRITMTLTGLYKEYSETLRRSSEDMMTIMNSSRSKWRCMMESKQYSLGRKR